MDQHRLFVEPDLRPGGEALPILRPLRTVGGGGPVVGLLDVFPQFTGQVVGLENELAERLGRAAFMAGGVAQQHQRLFRRIVNPGGEFGAPEKISHSVKSLWFGFKQPAWQAGLPDNGLQSSDAYFGVIGHRYGDRAVGCHFLHDDMAAASPDLNKAVAPQNGADRLTRQHS